MINLNSISSLTEFKRNTPKFLEKMQNDKHPLILTIQGEAALVVLDKSMYQDLINQIEFTETVREVNEAIKSFKEGKGRPAKDALRDLAEKL